MEALESRPIRAGLPQGFLEFSEVRSTAYTRMPVRQAEWRVAELGHQSFVCVSDGGDPSLSCNGLVPSPSAVMAWLDGCNPGRCSTPWFAVALDLSWLLRTDGGCHARHEAEFYLRNDSEKICVLCLTTATHSCPHCHVDYCDSCHEGTCTICGASVSDWDLGREIAAISPSAPVGRSPRRPGGVSPGALASG
jgi:hypothetical protein